MRQPRKSVVLKIVCGCFLLVLASSCTQSYNLEGKIAGIDDGIVLLQALPLSQVGEAEPFQDTLTVQDGRFHYDLESDESVIMFLFPVAGEFTRLDGSPYHAPQMSMSLLLTPDANIKLDAELKDYHTDYTLTGSEFNEMLSEIRSEYIERTSEAVRVELKIDTLMYNNGDPELIEELFARRGEISRKESAAHLSYVKNNWDDDLSAYFLATQPPDTMGMYYSNLAPEVREGPFSHMLEHSYRAFQRYTATRQASDEISEGVVAADFHLENIDGSEFRLSTIGGADQYIVLYFWGSWCPPCIQELPSLREYYDKNNAAVEFVGISHGDSDAEWRSAVEQYDLNWIQLINNPDAERDVAVMYGVQAYPTKFILDADLNILGRYIGSSETFFQDLDTFIRQ